jgi:hypothetical protein
LPEQIPKLLHVGLVVIALLLVVRETVKMAAVHARKRQKTSENRAFQETLAPTYRV